ncbi:ricin b lectin [Stylonychia lemnae]|uniref:Ricin b lectin n=1 Tax=Stylonychia lemnae TaxID=5949 RepID=A0A078AJA3_STYLE|nr:ricin b lectin [Stylonychia lemnae]|eukprot:CDW82309.1 ricin b lectin [Stylonychia lemnae]
MLVCALFSVVLISSYQSTAPQNLSFVIEDSKQLQIKSDHPHELQQVALVLDAAIDKVLDSISSKAVDSLMDMFFPPAQPDYDAIWKNIKDRVESLCKDLISDEYANELEKRLQGLKNDLQLYQQTSFGSPQKGQYMTNLLSYIAESEPFFFDNRNPEKTMPYFTQMGTITMTVHREQLANFRNIYGQDDIDQQQHIADLKNKISGYVTAGQTMYDTAVNWRAGFIRFQKTDHTVILHDIEFFFIDDKTGTKTSLGSDSGDFPVSESRAREAYEAEKDKVLNAFRAELDQIVLPSQKWQYFDSTLYPMPYEPQKKQQFVYSGPFGQGMSSGEKDFDDLNLFKTNGSPSKILVRGGSRIDAVQFTYGTIDGPLHGGISGGPNTINLGMDRKIIKVGVHAGQAVDGLTFFTDNGDRHDYGGRGGNYYEIAAPVQGAYLAAIQGKQGSHSIEAITFVWVFYA